MAEAGSGRLVAVGDLHGDLGAAWRALRLAAAVDADGRFRGGGLELVQTGDLVDRGNSSLEVLALFDRLRREAAAGVGRPGGGAVTLLLGNHELMNLEVRSRRSRREEAAMKAGAAGGPRPAGRGIAPRSLRLPGADAVNTFTVRG